AAPPVHPLAARQRSLALQDLGELLGRQLLGLIPGQPLQILGRLAQRLLGQLIHELPDPIARHAHHRHPLCRALRPTGGLALAPAELSYRPSSSSSSSKTESMIRASAGVMSGPSGSPGTSPSTRPWNAANSACGSGSGSASRTGRSRGKGILPLTVGERALITTVRVHALAPTAASQASSDGAWRP